MPLTFEFDPGGTLEALWKETREVVQQIPAVWIPLGTFTLVSGLNAIQHGQAGAPLMWVATPHSAVTLSRGQASDGRAIYIQASGGSDVDVAVLV